jgi:hypothetical protein
MSQKSAELLATISGLRSDLESKESKIVELEAIIEEMKNRMEQMKNDKNEKKSYSRVAKNNEEGETSQDVRVYQKNTISRSHRVSRSPSLPKKEFSKKPYEKKFVVITDPYTLDSLPNKEEVEAFTTKEEITECVNKLKHLRSNFTQKGENPNQENYQLVNNLLTSVYDIKNSKFPSSY